MRLSQREMDRIRIDPDRHGEGLIGDIIETLDADRANAVREVSSSPRYSPVPADHGESADMEADSLGDYLDRGVVLEILERHLS